MALLMLYYTAGNKNLAMSVTIATSEQHNLSDPPRKRDLMAKTASAVSTMCYTCLIMKHFTCFATMF